MVGVVEGGQVRIKKEVHHQNYTRQITQTTSTRHFPGKLTHPHLAQHTTVILTSTKLGQMPQVCLDTQKTH